MSKAFRIANVVSDQRRINHLKPGWHGQYTTLDGRRVMVVLSGSKKEALKELTRLQKAVHSVD